MREIICVMYLQKCFMLIAKIMTNIILGWVSSLYLSKKNTKWQQELLEQKLRGRAMRNSNRAEQQQQKLKSKVTKQQQCSNSNAATATQRQQRRWKLEVTVSLLLGKGSYMSLIAIHAQISLSRRRYPSKNNARFSLHIPYNKRISCEVEL